MAYFCCCCLFSFILFYFFFFLVKGKHSCGRLLLLIAWHYGLFSSKHKALGICICVCSFLFEVQRQRITRVSTSSALSSGSKDGALESLSEIQYKMILGLEFLRKLVWVEHQREGHKPKHCKLQSHTKISIIFIIKVESWV